MGVQRVPAISLGGNKGDFTFHCTSSRPYFVFKLLILKLNVNFKLKFKCGSPLSHQVISQGIEPNVGLRLTTLRPGHRFLCRASQAPLDYKLS